MQKRIQWQEEKDRQTERQVGKQAGRQTHRILEIKAEERKRPDQNLPEEGKKN